ncbi:hypothetical protein PSA7680_01385 [Pseudoruegeria aquimaris]|uniref:Glycine zipper domain-containing protein n=1 Tax=Pseudoruegeria aquimaris TaxID=393663 RepID=A0A1Y5S1J3_9RHOB|nr:glycine zipper domain-containing protein [Pseudoruegeria aquimaris]SLN29532.1 hypothetical protein PSA7680_01385 [Pseudoruegeria aquimaris]
MSRAKVSVFVAALGVLALGACDGMSQSEKRAAQGATAGALVGLATAGSDPTKSAATGALIGGAAGAVLGNAEDNN